MNDDDRTWWDKIPEDDRALVAIGLGFVALFAFIVFLAAL